MVFHAEEPQPASQIDSHEMPMVYETKNDTCIEEIHQKALRLNHQF